MNPKNYNAMYRSNKVDDADNTKENFVEPAPVEVKEEDTIPVEKLEEPIKKEEPKPKKVKKKDGMVIGSLSLNIRKEPNGEIIGSAKPGSKVVIIDEVNDWYKIEDPANGFVMKKFIEV